MNITHHFTVVLLLAFVLGGAACSKKDDTKEKQRLAQEQQDERDAAIANKAISDNNKNGLGRKPPNFDLGLPPVTDNGTAQTQTQQP